MDMETIYLTDITGTIGEWLDTEFDSEVPNEIVSLIEKAYNLAVKELNKEVSVDNNLVEDLLMEQKEQM